jgi:hypothetical protein
MSTITDRLRYCAECVQAIDRLLPGGHWARYKARLYSDMLAQADKNIVTVAVYRPRNYVDK